MIRAGDSSTLRRLRRCACLHFNFRTENGFAGSTREEANADVLITRSVAICCALATFRVGYSPMQMEVVGKGLFL